ncbi:MAG TPA: J domain-containing protein [bacterium]
MADYYNLLGVPRDATEEQIRSAFRKAAKRSHPDAHAQSSPRQQAEAQQRFIQLAQAYEALSHAGLRRKYDEKLKADEAAAAAAKRPAGARPASSTPSASPERKSDRQARADSVRRPSPDGERQSRTDQARKSTERGAEHRQREAEHQRRERERAQHEAREQAEIRRRRHAQAEARRTTTAGRRPGPDRPLDEIIDDVETLLGRFGLDLRTPVEVIWDTLLAWARRLFRDTEPPEAARPRAKPRAQPHFRSKAPPREPPPRPEPPPKPPPSSSARRRSSFRDGAVDAEFREIHDEPTVDQRAEDLELERELADLKRGKRDSGASGPSPSTPKSRPSPEDEELAALKRKLGKE